MTAEQTYITGPAGLDWKTVFRRAGISILRAVDKYEKCMGHISGKLAGVFRIFNARFTAQQYLIIVWECNA